MIALFIIYMGGQICFRVGKTMEFVPRGTFYVNKIVGVSLIHDI